MLRGPCVGIGRVGVIELVEPVVGDWDGSVGQPAQEATGGRAPGQPGADATGPVGAFPPGKQRDKLCSDAVLAGQQGPHHGDQAAARAVAAGRARPPARRALVAASRQAARFRRGAHRATRVGRSAAVRGLQPTASAAPQPPGRTNCGNADDRSAVIAGTAPSARTTSTPPWRGPGRTRTEDPRRCGYSPAGGCHIRCTLPCSPAPCCDTSCRPPCPAGRVHRSGGRGHIARRPWSEPAGRSGRRCVSRRRTSPARPPGHSADTPVGPPQSRRRPAAGR